MLFENMWVFPLALYYINVRSETQNSGADALCFHYQKAFGEFIGSYSHILYFLVRIRPGRDGKKLSAAYMHLVWGVTARYLCNQ